MVRKTAVGVFAFWYQLTSLKNSLLVLFCAVVAWALAIVGWRRARRDQLVVWPFVLPAFYLNAVLAVLLALGRYSAPVIPALLVVSGFGADALLSRVPAPANVPAARTVRRTRCRWRGRADTELSAASVPQGGGRRRAAACARRRPLPTA